jgi:3-oxoacyl-[acyl-carrier-protein] synthase III
VATSRLQIADDGVGLLSTGVYLPAARMSALEIAARSGLPENVVREKLGIVQKPVPEAHDHTNAMGVWAAQKALEKAKLEASQLDLIICISEEHKEFPVWTAGIDMARQLGASKAWAFDAAQKCGSFVLAAKLAKSMMLEDSSLKTVLIAGGYRNVDLIDYQDPNVRFMYNLGAGGGAAILRRGGGHALLGSSFITDGDFSRDVLVPVGGTCAPLTPENVVQYRLQVPDPSGMKARLEQKSLDNFVRVVQDAAEKSGFGEIDYLALLHMKKSAHNSILERLGLSESQTIYLSEYGHIGQIDQILSLELAQERRLVQAGSRVVLAAAGVGYVWNAVGVQW